MLLVAPVAGCGFTPVYGTGGTGNSLRNRLLLEPPDTRLGFVLLGRLEQRLGRPDSASFVLTYDIETEDRDLAVTGADDITRVNVAGTLRFTVSEVGTDRQVQSGDVSTFTAYSTTGSPVATVAARRDAEDRLMIALADQLVTRLLAGAPGWT